MFITKSEPDVSTDGAIKNGIKISRGVLEILKDDGNLKYADGKWYVLGVDNKWYFLGVGANPVHKIEKEDILNHDLFNNVFEEVDDEKV